MIINVFYLFTFTDIENNSRNHGDIPENEGESSNYPFTSTPLKRSQHDQSEDDVIFTSTPTTTHGGGDATSSDTSLASEPPENTSPEHSHEETVQDEEEEVCYTHTISLLNQCLDKKYSKYLLEYPIPFPTIDLFFDYLLEKFDEISSEIGYPTPNSLIQIHVEVNLVRATPLGEIEISSSFHVCLKFMKLISNEDLISLYRTETLRRVDSQHGEGSGYLIKDITRTKISVAQSDKTIYQYSGFPEDGQRRKYPYPAKYPGNHFLININTENNCVEYCLISHFLKQNNGRAYSERTYRRHRNIFFTFPDIQTPVKIEDFSKIERATECNIFLYNLSREKNGDAYTLKLLRKGENKSALPKNQVALLQLEEIQHVCLIYDLEKYLKVVYEKGLRRNSHLKDRKICRFCISPIQSLRLNEHEKICAGLKSCTAIEEIGSHESLSFSAFDALEYYHFVAYYDFESIMCKPQNNSQNNKNIINTQDSLSYSYIIVDKDNNIKDFKIKVRESMDEDLDQDFVNSLSESYDKLMTEYEKTWNREYFLTEEEEKRHQEAKYCEVCQREFNSKTPKVRHHRWCKNPEYDSNNKLIVSNFLFTACQHCNLNISIRYRSLPVIGHYSAKYDSCFVIRGYNNDKFSDVNILSKSGETYMAITFKPKKGKSRYSLRFIDSFNFLSHSLANLTQNLTNDNHPFSILKTFMTSQGYNNDTISRLTRKNSFPYEYVDDLTKLKLNSLPPINEFYSNITEETITQEEYLFACKLFSDSGCKTLCDYMMLYLMTDVLLLAEIFQNFRTMIYDSYSLDPAAMLSSPGLSIQSFLYSSKAKLGLIKDVEVYTLFEDNVRGGLVSTVEGYSKFNLPSFDDYDEKAEISSGGFIDFNSLYPYVLTEKLPTGNMYELTQEEVKNFDYINVDVDGDYAYALLIDYYIPDDVKRYTDEFPLSIHKFSPKEDDISDFTKEILKNAGMKRGKTERLVASHLPMEKYLITIKLLKLFVEIGMVVTKVHRIFRFDQSAIFKDFILKNIHLRTNSVSTAGKSFFKLLSNSLFGRLLMNVRKFMGMNKMITTKKQFEKYINSPLLKECIPISENKLIMKMEKSKIKLQMPMFVGLFILNHSKTKMFYIYYQVLKHHYSDKVKLLYTDTDSLLIKFTGYNFLEEINKLPMKKYMDFSNFPKNHPMYDKTHAGELSYFKSECKHHQLVECVLLQSKCYSIRTNDIGQDKSAAKGVVKNKQSLLTHKLYMDIHKQSLHTFNITCANIVKRQNVIKLIKQRKTALTKVEIKRWWRDSITSFAYGHPDIPISKTIKKIDTKKQIKINQPSHTPLLNMNLNFKRSLPGRMLYNIPQ